MECKVQNHDVDAVFQALAHPDRRRILQDLQASGGSKSSGSIAKQFGRAWPTTTRHLRILEHAGLVRVHKHGRGRIYVLNTPFLLSTTDFWLADFQAE